MNHFQIPPLYFPTTVVFVDDSMDFLSNLSLQLSPSLAFRLFDSPADALQILNATDSSRTQLGDIFSRYHRTDDLPLTHHVIDVNLDKVHREIYNEQRFKQISVAVVDYDMPSINGLEFCRRISNPNIKKVLLTGKADAEIAVQAFNEGLIDRFILKQAPDAIGKLNQAIAELQRTYFHQTERMLADVLSIGKHAFLRDQKFAEQFSRLCDRLKIVEFYLCSEPDGLLMRTAEGITSLLLVPNEDELQGQYEIACEQEAPQELLDALKSKQFIPYFWKTGGQYTPECRDWRTYLFPATEVQGERLFRYAIVHNAPLHKNAKVMPYQQFLQELDQQK